MSVIDLNTDDIGIAKPIPADTPNPIDAVTIPMISPLLFTTTVHHYCSPLLFTTTVHHYCLIQDNRYFLD